MTVASPNDPPPNERSEPAPPAPSGETSGAARLLDEIRERMERLEGNLSLRERRLGRVEKALREADARLQSERAQFTSERDAIERDLSERLNQRERQLADTTRALEEHRKRLGAQLARERETLLKIERLTRERDEATAQLEKTRREHSEHQQQKRELETRLTDERRLRRGSIRADCAHPGIDAQPALPLVIYPAWLERWFERFEPIRARWGRLSPPQQMALRAAAVALPVMSLLITLTVFVRYPTTYRVTGLVTSAARDGDLLAVVARQSAIPGVDLHARPHEGILEIAATTHDGSHAVSQIDALARSIAERASQPATRPATFADRAERRGQLLARLAELTVDPEAATRPSSQQTGSIPAFAQARPADMPTNPLTLLADLESVLTRRESLSNRLAQIAKGLAAKTPETATISPDELQAILADDPRLQADMEVLAGREGELTAALVEILNGTRIRLDELPHRAIEADKAVAEELSKPQDPDVTEALTAIRDALDDWRRSAESLAASWKDQKAALETAGPDADPGARQAAMETAARKFLDTSGKALSTLRTSLDAITQGGDEPTKRLVMRNGLAQRLQPVIESRDGLAAAAQRAVATENVDLAGLLGRVTGLRAQVVDRRTRLEQSLRQQKLDAAQDEHERQIAALRQEREQSLKTAEELDETLVTQAVKVFWMLRDTSEGHTALVNRLNVERSRAEVLAELRGLDEADDRELAALPPPVELRTLAAAATDITRLGNRLGGAILGGLAPLLMAVLIALGLAAARYWRQSRESIEDYAKALRDPSPRHRPEPEPQE